MKSLRDRKPRLLRVALFGLTALSLLTTGSQSGGCSGSADEGLPPAKERVLGTGRAKARTVDDYLVHYGPWDSARIEVARRHQLVIVHPSGANLDRRVVDEIRQGQNPHDLSDDVIVLAYISVGEDLRTVFVTDEAMRSDPRFTGDGTGPRVDPRGPHPDGGPLEGIDSRGLPSPGGTGYASWYLDDKSADAGGADGKPDRNAHFGACFVNAGDPAWFEVLNGMTLDGPDRLAGLREILTTTHGRGLGCDGVFLDTIDTCAPNSYTNSASPNPSEFEWTAPGFSAFIRRLRETYPDRVILQNRGLFFFDSRHPHYRHTTRPYLDLALFESLRLNSNAFEEFSPFFAADNRFNVAPKIVAETQRPDGFRVLSLGYAEGPPDRISTLTLVGGSTLGMASLLEDIRVAEHENGFRHYLTDAPVTLVNSFVLDHANRDDRSPPAWSSTHNPGSAGNLPEAPPPRVGIQEVVPGPATLTVRWDVALDLHPVRYVLYVRDSPFDFVGNAPPSPTRLILEPRPGAGYDRGPGPGTFPFEATIEGLQPGRTYYLLLRAVDLSPQENEDGNRTVLTGAPQ